MGSGSPSSSLVCPQSPSSPYVPTESPSSERYVTQRNWKLKDHIGTVSTPEPKVKVPTPGAMSDDTVAFQPPWGQEANDAGPDAGSGISSLEMLPIPPIHEVFGDDECDTVLNEGGESSEGEDDPIIMDKVS